MRQHHHIKSALKAIRADNPLLTYEDSPPLLFHRCNCART
ncbi:hypothetical protein Y11_40121 [Yersinia enterocolitica subsp. palearctica Y11]|uniref:Uncharacterized protein n=2 Tax=Yersinia enterocolitica TaxID=630 RepID=A0A0H3NU35_YERE1|nr:unknown protein [Yersinia enterocolitica W22703]CBY28518.1 hypothetical protein Y11_40121 [Yersinia enterocolitica subsp. palearctica Y11]CCO70637.1 hypothetical protein D322_3785 [Yersinia enterocolitica IP 10393]